MVCSTHSHVPICTSSVPHVFTLSRSERGWKSHVCDLVSREEAWWVGVNTNLWPGSFNYSRGSIIHMLVAIYCRHHEYWP